ARGGRARVVLGDRQPGGARRRPHRVQRQLPRRAAGLCAGLPGRPDRRPGEHGRAAHRPHARRGPFARSATVPGRRPGRRLRLHDRAVHAGRGGLRPQAAGGARVGRLHPVVGDAGRPRVDGLVGGPQFAARRARVDHRAGRRVHHRCSGPRPAETTGTGRRDRGRRGAAAGAGAGNRAGPARGPGDRRGRGADRVRGRARRGIATPGRERMTPKITAARGTALTARSWQTEAPLRMLHNNLDPDVAEWPEDLVVYGGTGKAARDWPSFHAITRELTTLADDETLLVQSGKPVGVMRTHEWAPRVLIANSNLVPEWANWREFRRLEALGLTMYAQMTAGSWIYIGTQGILQGTYETFAAVADKRFGGMLAGTLTVTAGLGGMGGAQPLAITMNGGVALVVEVDPARARRRGETRYLDVVAEDLDEAIARVEAAKRERKPLSVGVIGNAADVLPELLRRGVEVDVVTDQTSAHDPLAYLPKGVALEDWGDYAASKPDEFTDRSRESMADHVDAMVGFLDRGAEVFDYGNSLRSEAKQGGAERAFDYPGFVPAHIRPLFCEGKGPFRWAALSGDPADIAATDRAILDLFGENEPLARWIRMAGERVAFQGLPARICWLGYGERHLAG